MLANIMLLYANVFTFYQQQLAIIVIPLPKDLIQYIRTVFFWIKRLDVIHGNYSFKAVHILYICIHIATLPIDIYDITVSMMTYGAYVIPQTYFSWWCVCVCVCESEWVSEWERDRQRERERERERNLSHSFNTLPYHLHTIHRYLEIAKTVLAQCHHAKTDHLLQQQCHIARFS